MCIRDRLYRAAHRDDADRIRKDVSRDGGSAVWTGLARNDVCLLYTSDAADERSSVDLGGRRIIKKKNEEQHAWHGKVHEKGNTRTAVQCIRRYSYTHE